MMTDIYVYGDSSDDVLDLSDLPFAYDAEVYGRDGDDTITTGAGSDVVYGGDENDEIDGGEGADSLFGGDGDDLLYFDSEDLVVSGDDWWGSYSDNDTLVLDGSIDAQRDFAEFEESVENMEVLDFENGVADEIGVYAGLDSDVTAEHIAAITDEDKTLYIRGDESDVLYLDDSSSFADYSDGKFYEFETVTEDGQDYQVYSALTDDGPVTLFVDADVSVV